MYGKEAGEILRGWKRKEERIKDSAIAKVPTRLRMKGIFQVVHNSTRLEVVWRAIEVGLDIVNFPT